MGGVLLIPILTLVLTICAAVVAFSGAYRVLKNHRNRRAGKYIAAGLGLAWLASTSFGVLHAQNFSTVVRILLGCYWVVLTYLIVNLIFFISATEHYRKARPMGQLDAVVVLGAGLRGTQVTPALAARLDRGLAVARATGAGVVVCAGGQGPDEVIAESEAMARYIGHVAPGQFDVVQENLSTTTAENVDFSQPLVAKLFPGGARVAIVTSDYHVLRARALARQRGLPWQGLGAPAFQWQFFYGFWREFAAVNLLWWRWNCVALVAFIAGVVAWA